MKKLLLKSILFTIIFILALIGFSALINYKINREVDFKVDYPNLEYAFFGHSHPETAYNDSIIDNFKNFSRSGESYFYTYHKIKKVINENKNIKFVFIEYTNNQVNDAMDEWIWGDKYLDHRFLKFEPFIGFSDQLVLLKKSPERYIDVFLKSKKKSVNRLIVSNYKLSKYDKFGGYNYLIRDKTDSLANVHRKLTIFKPKENFKRSVVNITYLKKAIEYCKSLGIEVMLTRSPLHQNYQGFRNELMYQDILKSGFKDVEFIDFKDFPLENHHFADLEHLNFKGAKLYSLWFNNLIHSQSLLKQENKQILIEENIKRLSSSQENSLEKLVNDKELNRGHKIVKTILSNQNGFEIKSKLNNTTFLDSIYLSSNESNRSLLIKLRDDFSPLTLKGMSFGVHCSVYEKDFKQRPKWLIDKSSDLLTFNVKPEFINLNEQKYILIVIKKKCSIDDFKKLKFFLQNEDKYRGVIGKAISINKVSFKTKAYDR